MDQNTINQLNNRLEQLQNEFNNLNDNLTSEYNNQYN